MESNPTYSRMQSGRRLAVFITWCVFLIVAFCRPLWILAGLAKTDLHSHTLLIPLISAYLIFVERRRLPRQFDTAWVPAALLAVIAVGLIVAAGSLFGTLTVGREESVAVHILSFVLLVNAGALLCFGADWMRAAAFPMAFLAFVVPLPEAMVFHLEECLKVASAEAAALLFGIAGVPVLRDGVVFQLPGITLEVARECSGIRSSYVLLMTSLIGAHLFLRSPWRRVFLVAVVIPLGIIRNGFRIVVIGWLCVHYGPQMIDTWIHHHGGPVFFVLSLFPLFLLLWWLWQAEKCRQGISLNCGPRAEGGPARREQERFS